MQMTDLLAALGTPDWLALGLFLLTWAGIGRLIEHPPAGRPSVASLMKGYRREWMRQFVTRPQRIFDASIVGDLRQGTSFLASTCLIAIGGGLALAGDPERLQGLASELDLGAMPRALWQVKMLLVVLFLTNALLKFVWANRLFGYCGILMGAVPNDPADPTAARRAAQAAEVNISAAKSFNRGLRSVYFALGALGWLLGPWGLVATTAATLFVTWRREFASQSRRVLMETR